MTENWQDGGFGLYVHWPFCQAKCPYCDFNSHVVSAIDQNRWARALAREIDRYAEKTPNRILRSIFFGGGTPSLMAPDTVAHVLDAAQKGWRWSNEIEVTLEANPTSVETDRFKEYAKAGVNRVSLGVQALNDTDLHRLGRLHDTASAMRALDIAQEAFGRVSFDLIYARQDQTLADWEQELGQALALQPDHLSLYQLTIEQGTAFWDRREKGGLKGLPDEDLAADMYELTQDLCRFAGLEAYEVSNHARPGAESLHNLIYWFYGDWVGVGPGAHGRLTLDSGERVANVAFTQPGRWMAAVEEGCGDDSVDGISASDAMSEFLMMGLRVAKGIDYARFHRFPGAEDVVPRINEMIDDGFLWSDGQRFGTTDQGRLLLNQVIAALLPED